MAVVYNLIVRRVITHQISVCNTVQCRTAFSILILHIDTSVKFSQDIHVIDFTIYSYT